VNTAAQGRIWTVETQMGHMEEMFLPRPPFV